MEACVILVRGRISINWSERATLSLARDTESTRQTPIGLAKITERTIWMWPCDTTRGRVHSIPFFFSSSPNLILDSPCICLSDCLSVSLCFSLPQRDWQRNINETSSHQPKNIRPKLTQHQPDRQSVNRTSSSYHDRAFLVSNVTDRKF